MRIILSMLCLIVMNQMALAGAVRAKDVTGRVVQLAKPASHLVVLAPTPVEVLYEIGAGDRIVAAVDYADYPAAAKKLPRVGNAFSISLDAIVRYQPDLVVAWKSQAQDKVVERLRELGIPVYLTNPTQLEDVANDMTELGKLTGLQKASAEAAAKYRASLRALRKKFSHKKPVRVFLQLNENPIFTVNDKNILGQVITVCGGQNVFGKASALAPQVSLEAVVRAQPQAIFGTMMQRLDMWLTWRAIPAVAGHLLYVLLDDTISRPGPRLPEGMALFCQKIDESRQKLSQK